jgi:glycyl-tRNA synthetase beta subunit
MKKQDIIRIINEEVDIALDEMIDPIYNSNLPEIVASLIVSGVTIKQIIKFILEKYKNTKNGDKLDKDTIVEIIKKAKSKLNESINEEEEVYNVIDRETKKLITDTPLIKSLALKLAAKKKDGKWIIQKHKESINENEGMTKSLKDIDPSLSLTKYDTTPPSFKVTYIRKDDMSKEMEEELVAWVLSKGGRVDSVETMFDVEDGERYYYPYVKFSYK